MKNLVKMNLYSKSPSMSEKRQLIQFLCESLCKNSNWLKIMKDNNGAGSGNSRSNSFDDTAQSNGKKSKSKGLLKWGGSKRTSGINIEDINKTKEAQSNKFEISQLPPDVLTKKKKKQGWFKRNILKKISRSKQKRGINNLTNTEIEHDNVFVNKKQKVESTNDKPQTNQSQIVHDNPEMTLTQIVESISAKEGVLAAKLEESTKAYDKFLVDMNTLEQEIDGGQNSQLRTIFEGVKTSSQTFVEK